MQHLQQILLQKIANGYTHREIANELGVCESTIEKKASYLIRKFGAKNKTHLVLIAIKKGLIAAMLLLLTTVGKAQYLAGGNLLYEYIGPSWCAVFGCPYQAYRVTLKLILTDSSQFAPTARMFVWNKDNNMLWYARDQPLDAIVKLREHRDPCVLGDSLAYWCGYYKLTVDLAPNLNGYICSYQQGL